MKNKKVKIGLIALAAVLVIAAGVYFVFLRGSGDNGDIAAAEGEVYRTKTESFWAGFGKAYISFLEKEEPENVADDDTALYGKVFSVMGSARDSEFASWLDGYWELEDDTLTLTGMWDISNPDAVRLEGAESGVPFTYKADENGVFTITVWFQSNGDVDFTFDPANDRIVDGKVNAEEGKDDEPEEMKTGNMKAELSAKDTVNSYGTDFTCYAKLNVYNDGTWIMYAMVPGSVDNYTEAARGTWTENADRSLSMTLTKETAAGSMPSGFTVKASGDGDNITYSAYVNFVSYLEFHLNFQSGVIYAPQSTAKPSEEPQIPQEMKGEIYRSPIYNGLYSGIVGSAYLSFKDLDASDPDTGLTGKTFVCYASRDGQSYNMWFDGYWSLNGDKLTLTMEHCGESGLDNAQKGAAKVYTAQNGAFIIPAHFEGGGTAVFTLDPKTDKVGNEPANPTPTPTPTPTPDPGSKELQLTLTAADTVNSYGTDFTCSAKLLVYGDNSWRMDVKVPGVIDDYTEAASGTWSLNSDYSMSFKTVKQTAENSMPASFKINCDTSAYPDLKYSGTVDFTSYFTFHLNFSDTVSPIPDPDPDNPDPVDPDNGDEYKTAVSGKIWLGLSGKSYILFRNIDTANDLGHTGKVYEIWVAQLGDRYRLWSDGYWSLNGTSLTLTPAKQTKSVLTIGVDVGSSKTYTADANGVFGIDLKFFLGGKTTVRLDPSADKLGSDPVDPVDPVDPTPGTGIVYKTDVSGKIWAGIVGSCYMQFKDSDTPNEWGESGKVYELWVAQTGSNYSMWSDGYWDITDGVLTLTPVNQSENGSIGVDAGASKFYTLNNGAYTIDLGFSSGGKTSVTLKP